MAERATLHRMTKLSSIPEHEIAIECRVCGHAGLVPVAAVLAKGDRTVAELVAAARCSRCRAKIVVTYRIVYGGRCRRTADHVAKLVGAPDLGSAAAEGDLICNQAVGPVTFKL